MVDRLRRCGLCKHKASDRSVLSAFIGAVGTVEVIFVPGMECGSMTASASFGDICKRDVAVFLDDPVDLLGGDQMPPKKSPVRRLQTDRLRNAR